MLVIVIPTYIHISMTIVYTTECQWTISEDMKYGGEACPRVMDEVPRPIG
jgi:hypothetical protein